jgi:hypothetical protein
MALGFTLATRAQNTGSDLTLQFIRDGDQQRLRWASVVGQDYVVQARTNLTTDPWKEVLATNASSPVTIWMDPSPPEGGRFYRIVYQVIGMAAPVTLVHASQPSGIPELGTASFTQVRDRLQVLAAAGSITLPFPMTRLEAFDNLAFSNAFIELNDTERTVVIGGDTILRGETVPVLFLARWSSDDGPPLGFSLGVKLPRFELTQWVSGLAEGPLANLGLGDSIITLATSRVSLPLSELSGSALDFYGAPTVNLEPGISYLRQVDLARFERLVDPLKWLGFSNTTVELEGYLGVNPDFFFQGGSPAPALRLLLRAHLPISQTPGFPGWLVARERTLEFTNDPTLRVRLLDLLEATPDGQQTFYLATTELATDGTQESLTLAGSLVAPWVQPFGLGWLTLDQASLAITIAEAGAGEVRLDGSFAVGDTIVTTDLNLAQSGATNQASFVGTADTLALNDVLGLLETVSGVEPFGPGLPDDALVLSNVRLSFESGDERSIELSATSTILDTVQTDVLLAFLTPQNGPSLLTLGMHVHQFRLRELYAGVNGTIAGELEFPDVAFTVVQEVPNPPTEPFTIPSSSLSPTAEDFYRALRGPTPFTLELNAGLNFAGKFPQSRLPALVLDTLGMDPNAEVLVEGALASRLGALTGGGPVALDSLHLQATLPLPTQPPKGTPQWLNGRETLARTLAFDYVAPDIQMRITDRFQVVLDDAARTFTTSTTLATQGDQQAELSFTGDMEGGWSQPFGVGWLTLDTVGFSLTTDGTNATASLHSSFALGTKNIALDLGISGGAANRLVRFAGRVDSLSLADFVELARKHLGTEAAPFGDSTFDFAFGDVTMTIETGTRRSFSIAALTTLRGKLADVLFSATWPAAGGSPHIVTGLQIQDWSLADLLDEPLSQVGGPAAENFRSLVEELVLERVALVLSKGDGTTSASEMSGEARAFYRQIFGTDNFLLEFQNGLSLIGGVPMAENALNSGLSVLGMDTDRLFVRGTIPGSVLGLGGGGFGLAGLSLAAALPPISPPGSPEWFVQGQVALVLTAQPSLGFVGELTVNIEEEELTFSVSAAVQRVGASVEFSLAGGLKAAEPWEQPFGIEWLVFNEARLKVGVTATGSLTLGFLGDMVIGEKDLAVTVLVTVSPTGLPTNFIFDGQTEEGFAMEDLVMLQQQMAAVATPGARMIELANLPPMAVKNLGLKFAPRPSSDPKVDRGFYIKGDLFLPTSTNGVLEFFAGVELSLDESGILANAQLADYALGPIAWSNAFLDLVLNLQEQRLAISGLADLGDLLHGELAVNVTRQALGFSTSTRIIDQFEAQLEALGSFSLADPSFAVTGTMANEFQNSIRTSLASRMRTYASDPAHVTFADKMLDQNVALGGAWRTFSGNSNPGVYFTSVPGFLADAGYSIPAWVPEVQDAISKIDAALPGTPSDLLGKALRGITVTICVLRNPITGNCISEQSFHYGGGCHEYPISCTASGLINNDMIPLLIGRIDTILNSVPLVSIQSASFTADLAELRNGEGIRMAVNLSFMNQPESLVVNGWTFADTSRSVIALRDALVQAF